MSTLPTGEHDFSVCITASLRPDKVPAKLPSKVEYGLAVAARVLPNAYAVPASLNFGVVGMGEMLEAKVAIGTLRGTFFDVNSYRGNHDSTTIQAERPPRMRSEPKVFTVRQHVVQAGPFSSTVDFVLDLPGGGGSNTITVPVSYYGLEAKSEGIDGTKGEVSFGE
jgi:hypothetical protein